MFFALLERTYENNINFISNTGSYQRSERASRNCGTGINRNMQTIH